MVLDKVFPPRPESGAEAAPLCVTVFYGANDACLPDRYGGFQHVPIEEYKQNLHSIVSYLKVLTAKLYALLEYTSPPHTCILPHTHELGDSQSHAQLILKRSIEVNYVM